MSRHYRDEVEVRLGDPVEHRVRLEPGWRRSAEPETAEVPTLFLWRGRVHVVRGVLAQWTRRTPWWRDTEGAEVLEHQVWRVEARAGKDRDTGVYDLVHGAGWVLDRVSD